ncbi:MAG TPA: histidine phosphatase family protein [Pirellulales bacterium]|jgi:probable phosphoglycerate mutase|nr:histidine phosphatase family protein [Pirellulales bacterium]
MLQIVLVHPGSTDYDEQGRIQGTLDIPLNDQGKREVEHVVAELRPLAITAVYCGPSQAASETAIAISEALGVKLKKLDMLQNLDHGLWQGMLIEDVRRKQPKVYRGWQEQPTSVCPPEGEMLNTAQERVQSALTKIIKKHKQGTIAVVAPEPLASVIHCQLRHCAIGDLWKSGGSCGKWEVISLEAQQAAAGDS